MAFQINIRVHVVADKIWRVSSGKCLAWSLNLPHVKGTSIFHLYKRDSMKSVRPGRTKAHLTLPLKIPWAYLC